MLTFVSPFTICFKLFVITQYVYSWIDTDTFTKEHLLGIILLDCSTPLFPRFPRTSGREQCSRSHGSTEACRPRFIFLTECFISGQGKKFKSLRDFLFPFIVLLHHNSRLITLFFLCWKNFKIIICSCSHKVPYSKCVWILTR